MSKAVAFTRHVINGALNAGTVAMGRSCMNHLLESHALLSYQNTMSQEHLCTGFHCLQGGPTIIQGQV